MAGAVNQQTHRILYGLVKSREALLLTQTVTRWWNSLQVYPAAGSIDFAPENAIFYVDQSQ
jgi:hypothetical protein